jgi:hypothetical protein
MARSAVLLLILGLAAGLWLGFNPQAHQQTIQKWDSVKSSYVKFMAGTTAKIQGMNTGINTSLQTSPRVKLAPQSQPNVSQVWRQVSAAFETAWNSMKSFLANATAKINTTK